MIVQQFKGISTLSVQQLLTQLQNCHGLFFLAQKKRNIIGLLPKWRLVALNKQHFITEHRTDSGYQVQHHHTNYSDALLTYWKNASSVISNQPRQYLIPTHFQGGLMSYLAYDNPQNMPPNTTPQAIFADYDVFLKQEADGWCLYGKDSPELQPYYQQIYAALQAPPPHQPFKLIQPFAPVWQYNEYKQAFLQVQRYLQQGDCYQVNLTQAYKARVQGKLLGTLDALYALTQAPYAGYVSYQNYEVLSCSPELFIEFKANQQLITRPIKGTQPRHHSPAIDEHNKQALIHSEKDRSENLMIVDLLRNDLSKHAVLGSVTVSKLFDIESFAQVHHMVSEIRATLRPNSSPLEVLLSAFPGGSITGAPKIRAMQIINELEAEPRGAYCGSMGYLNYDNTGSFNILIRTIQQHEQTITAWAGGGITIASTCQAEYQECEDKISAILQCINQCGSN